MDPLTIISLTSLALSALGTGHSIASTASKNDKNDLTSEEANEALKHFNSTYANDLASNPYWNSLSNSEKLALMQEYKLGEYTDGVKNVDYGSLIDDLAEYHKITGTAPKLSDYVDVNKSLSDAQSAIDDENEQLLQSLNEDLQSTGDAYTRSQDALLTQQHQTNAQTLDTMASEMSRSRRNAIEAGASAGVRIAENVNTLLSAQNQISQRSLETSNQLAQMLVSQRNAEAGLRNQWRDAQLSTYDRVQSRASNERALGQARYDEAASKYQEDLDANTSASNPLVDRMARYKSNSSSKY